MAATVAATLMMTIVQTVLETFLDSVHSGLVPDLFHRAAHEVMIALIDGSFVQPVLGLQRILERFSALTEAIGRVIALVCGRGEANAQQRVLNLLTLRQAHRDQCEEREERGGGESAAQRA